MSYTYKIGNHRNVAKDLLTFTLFLPIDANTMLLSLQILVNHSW